MPAQRMGGGTTQWLPASAARCTLAAGGAERACWQKGRVHLASQRHGFHAQPAPARQTTGRGHGTGQLHCRCPLLGEHARWQNHRPGRRGLSTRGPVVRPVRRGLRRRVAKQLRDHHRCGRTPARLRFRSGRPDRDRISAKITGNPRQQNCRYPVLVWGGDLVSRFGRMVTRISGRRCQEVLDRLEACLQPLDIRAGGVLFGRLEHDHQLAVRLKAPHGDHADVVAVL